MPKPDEVKTVAMARRMSLIKWNRIRGFSRDLFNEIDTSCGFCNLARQLAEKEKGRVEKCDHCQVDTRCHAIQDVSGDIEDKLMKMIEGTISFLEDMDVTEK